MAISQAGVFHDGSLWNHNTFFQRGYGSLPKTSTEMRLPPPLYYLRGPVCFSTGKWLPYEAACLFPHPLGLSLLHPWNPAVTTKECPHKLTFTGRYPSPSTQTDNPPLCPFKHSSIWRLLQQGTNILALCCSQTHSRLTKGGWEKEKQVQYSSIPN